MPYLVERRRRKSTSTHQAGAHQQDAEGGEQNGAYTAGGSRVKPVVLVTFTGT